MISAFAKGAQTLGDERYLSAARLATEFLIRNMYDAQSGTLLRRFRDGDAAIPGFLDDYAFFTQALLDMYETTFEFRYLELAVQLAGKMIELFEDEQHGGFFSTAEGDSSLVLRIKDDHDGAEPSGNSIAALALLRLARMTNNQNFAAGAERTLAGFRATLENGAGQRTADAGRVSVQQIETKAGDHLRASATPRARAR